MVLRTKISLLREFKSKRNVCSEEDLLGPYSRYRAHLDADLLLLAQLHQPRVFNQREAGWRHVSLEASGPGHILNQKPAHPWPMRFVPNKIASYRFMSAALPSPSVSPAWNTNGTFTPLPFCFSKNRRNGSA